MIFNVIASPHTRPESLEYRPHIDGLRAIAVLSVLVYHAGFEILKGGFLGVDVFFVLSGYLITSIIQRELGIQRFSFKRFYLRRARRLLPVLYLVLAVTTVYAWQYLMPSDFEDYAKSLASTILFVSNFWFYFQDNYHAAESAAKPLLHTWSLGVEEQFYLFFPFFLWLLRAKSTKNQLIAIISVICLSFACSVLLSGTNAEANFYLLPTRIWELEAGCLLAFVPFNSFDIGKLKTAVIATAALSALLLSFFFIDANSAHPGVATLIPVMATMILIQYGAKTTLIAKLLQNGIATYIGKLSYSIYLWHFPVFAVAYIKHQGQAILLNERIELIALVVVLSVASYHFVERPIRLSNKIKSSYVVSGLVLCSLVFISFSIYVVHHGGLKHRLGEIENIFAGADREDSFLKKDGKRCYFNVRNPKSCKFIVDQDAINLINMGDSHANAISVPLAEYAAHSGINFYNMILSHCPYIRDAWRHTGFKAKCEASQMDAVREYMLKQPPSIVVYTVRFPMYLNSDRFSNGEGGVEHSLFFPFRPTRAAMARGETISDLIVKTLNELGEMGHKVVLVYPVPEVGWNIPKLVKNRLDEIPRYPLGRKRQKFEEMSITTSYDVYKKRIAFTKNILDQVTHQNIFRVYPERIFCSDETGRCRTHNKTSLFYYDDDHLSRTGASMLVDKIAEILEDELSLLVEVELNTE